MLAAPFDFDRSNVRLLALDLIDIAAYSFSTIGPCPQALVDASLSVLQLPSLNGKGQKDLLLLLVFHIFATGVSGVHQGGRIKAD